MALRAIRPTLFDMTIGGPKSESITVNAQSRPSLLGAVEAASALGVSLKGLKDGILLGAFPRPDHGQVDNFALWGFSLAWVAHAQATLDRLPGLRARLGRIGCQRRLGVPATDAWSEKAARVDRAMKAANKKIPLFNRL